MNLLENYIKEIHSVAPYTADWTKEFDKDFVEVDMTTDCYGRENRRTHVFDTAEWEQIKKQGYHMA